MIIGSKVRNNIDNNGDNEYDDKAWSAGLSTVRFPRKMLACAHY